MSTPSTTPSTSSTGKPASPRGVATGNTTAPRARRGGQRGFMELYANLVRNPTKETLLNTASDLKEAAQMSLQNFGQHIERQLAAGAVSIPQLVNDTKAQIRIYLSPAERRQLVDQRAFGGRKTRKGKSRRRYTRRR